MRVTLRCIDLGYSAVINLNLLAWNHHVTSDLTSGLIYFATSIVWKTLIAIGVPIPIREVSKSYLISYP